MAETTTTTTETETESTEEQPTTTKDWEAEAKKWKELSRQNERQAKANADAAKKWVDQEESSKSEADKQAKQLADAQAKADASELKLLKIEVGLEKGLSKDQAQRLVGTNREELEEDAEQLIEAFGVKQSDDEGEEEQAPPERQPREKLRPGRKGMEPLSGDDPLLAELKRKVGV